MLKEFKAFAMQGNMLDLAIGVVIGAAFGKIVESMVKDVIMPIPAMAGGADFSNLFLVLKPGKDGATAYASLDAAVKAGAVTFNWGSFVTTVVQFVIVAFFLFLVVKAVNKMRKPADDAPAAPSDEVVLLTEIRDALKKS
ncbi:MAG: large conductance mechanosensitive channel protein MscL [Chthonomonadaceae bacterium]|nr:large conductance mechanosensitive channel protein MscL [Chthonomonadaceae bacterium]